MIKNTDFLNDVDVLIVDSEYCRPSKQFGYVDVPQIELIGLMTLWLLDKGGYMIKTKRTYNAHVKGFVARNTNLYDCLETAINNLEEKCE
jgi:hypothetical protein